MLKYLPNLLTTLRLLLALPLGAMIVDENFDAALLVGLAAGITDALDGFAARRLQVFSRIGAMLDPVADKVLVTVAFLSFAWVGLVGWPVAAVVIGRDLVIVAGAGAYRLLVGPIDFAASPLSKLNMGVQIGFCLLLLGSQQLGGLPAGLAPAATLAVVVAAVLSGADYIITWSLKTYRQCRREERHDG